MNVLRYKKMNKKLWETIEFVLAFLVLIIIFFMPIILGVIMLFGYMFTQSQFYAAICLWIFAWFLGAILTESKKKENKEEENES